MLYAYLIVSAALIPLLNNFFPILRQSYSLWLVPLLFVGFWLVLIILQLAVYIVSLCFVNLDKEPKCPQYFNTLGKMTLSIAVKLLRVKLKVSGGELLPENRFVLVCNHTHIVDPAMLMAAFPDADLAFLAKSEIKKELPLFAKIIHSLGGIFVERESVRGAATSMIKAIKAVKSGRVSLGIFPEGHRTKNGKLGEFKDGAFKIAKKTASPLVICTIAGANRVLKRIPKSTEVTIKVLRVFSSEEISGMTGSQLSDAAKNIMLTDLGE